MNEFEKAFESLNDLQKEAVEHLDGPVLVIAGPGTGKTQLISTRVGHILKTTDTPASNILLLTFTEAGAQAMRDRLNKLIGQASYDINLSTYHGFGGEIIRRYPDYFSDAELTLLDELGTDVALRSIIAKLPYSNPLKFADNYLSDIRSFISDAKRALLSSEDIKSIAADNLKFIKSVNDNESEILAQFAKISKKCVPAFNDLLVALTGQKTFLPSDILPLGSYAANELKAALDFCEAEGKTTKLTEWKKAWLAKDSQGQTIFDGKRQNERLVAAAEIYEKYQEALADQKQYDYDDMILRAIDALEANADFKYSLAEQYSFIMLDEFQDTNPAQMRLVQLLTDHPVHEGKPNILAVGDDDQAIYAFQGADHANMAAFARLYRDVKIISLKENYRSHQDILEVGRGIAEQIGERLHSQFENVEKILVASNNDLPEAPHISASEFISDAAEYDWVSKEIANLIKRNVKPSEIAVLAPKHRYLLPLLPYLANQKVPVRYERRENIIDEPIIHQVEQMARLVIALSEDNDAAADSLWPEILSYDFWQISTDKIWRAGWQARGSRTPWTAALLNDAAFSEIAGYFLRLRDILPLSTLEEQLDILIGREEATAKFKIKTKSPLFEFYFGTQAKQSPLDFTSLVSNLNILRSRLREWRRNHKEPLGLAALVEFIEGHRSAGLQILNTSPYHESTEAVNLLTAYGAKGREFQAVFIIAALDEVWGSSSRSQGYRLSLPANVSYIRYQGASEDERLRLLFVAATRARTRLYLSSYRQTLAGKTTSRLKYLNISEDEEGLRSHIIPEKFAAITEDDSEVLSQQTVENYWTDRHLPPFTPSLKTILAPRLERYQLSATHLNQFLDVINGGPEIFFLESILGFRGAPTLTSAYGTAIHTTLRWAGNAVVSEGNLPPKDRLFDLFKLQLANMDLSADDYQILLDRGQASLDAWVTQSASKLRPADRFEHDFASEGVIIGPAHMSGKIDHMIIDPKARTVTVLDYKTGQSFSRWEANVPKLHKFRQQLMIYKLLVEGSSRFSDYRVDRGVIEFVEPNENGDIVRLELDFNKDELDQLKSLVGAVWQHIQKLEFPPTDSYPPTVAGIKKFESDLISK